MIRFSFLANPSEVVKPTSASSRRSIPIGQIELTTAPPAGVTYAAAAVKSPLITSSTSSGQLTGASAMPVPLPVGSAPIMTPFRQPAPLALAAHQDDLSVQTQPSPPGSPARRQQDR